MSPNFLIREAKLFTPFLISVLLLSCSPVKESIIDPQNGKLIAGYSKKSIYQIGKTKESDIGRDEIVRLGYEKLEFKFDPTDSTDNNKNRLVLVGAAGRFSTTKGIKAGDSVEKVIQVYGKPKARMLDYGRDIQHGIYFEIPGLFYDRLTFFTDSTGQYVKAFMIGKEFDLNKKYIRY